jgi:hypothetical protein
VGSLRTLRQKPCRDSFLMRQYELRDGALVFQWDEKKLRFEMVYSVERHRLPKISLHIFLQSGLQSGDYCHIADAKDEYIRDNGGKSSFYGWEIDMKEKDDLPWQKILGFPGNWNINEDWKPLPFFLEKLIG